jgi:hypothetical protein
MGIDPGTLVGLAIESILLLTGGCCVGVLCRKKALRDAIEVEGEVKGLSFGLRFRTRREIPPEICASKEEGDRQIEVIRVRGDSWKISERNELT